MNVPAAATILLTVMSGVPVRLDARDAVPVTLPVNAPLKVVAVNVFEVEL